MLTIEGAQELVRWVEENEISFSWLIGPHIAFITIVIGFCILMLFGI